MKPVIGIDVSPLYDQNRHRGIGYFAKQLIPALQTEVKSNPEYQNFNLKLIKNQNLKTHKLNLIHFPYFHPFGPAHPSSKIPFITTVYDLIPRQFKQHYPVGIKGTLNWWLQKRRLKKSAYIITSSHYSKYIIVNILNYPADHIYVTYGAPNPQYKPVKNQKILKQIQKKYGLPTKFVLYVGDINWNKNIPSLVKACRQLGYPLVIVGSAAASANVPVHPWTQDLLWLQKQASAPAAQRPSGPILTGFIPDADMPAIYTLATLYCQPSFAEGFGLPVIEAMACGCPVAFSQESCLPEITNYNGQMFNPYSLNSLKQALKKLWTKPKLRQKYQKAGLAHAATFSWKLTARQTLAVYRLAIL